MHKALEILCAKISQASKAEAADRREVSGIRLGDQR